MHLNPAHQSSQSDIRNPLSLLAHNSKKDVTMSEKIFLLRHNYIFYCSQVMQIFALRLLFHFLLRCCTVEYESQQYQCNDHPSGQCCCSQTCKFIIVTFQIDHNDNRRNSIGNIIFRHFGNFIPVPAFTSAMKLSHPHPFFLVQNRR